jgi:uncharacterized membrane protein YccC
MRALRAVIVIPGVFALTFKVIGDLQMALFAVFGGFATLVLASFGGTRRDKAVAHLGLAVAGSIALIIGTAVSGTTWLAAIVTIPVAFAIFFAGVAGPNAATGVTGALLAYVLPVASAGTVATIPVRLAGWWLTSAVSTAAVLLLSPRSPGDRLRTATADLASALARCLTSAIGGETARADLETAIAARRGLIDLFAATPYRPTGLTTADQGLANVIELLEWCTSLAADALDGHPDLRQAAPTDRELLGAAASLLEDVAWLLNREDITDQDVQRDVDRVQRAREASAVRCWDLAGDPASVRASAATASHAEAIAVTAAAATADALIASGRADPELVAAQRRSWYAGAEGGQTAQRRLGGLAGAARIATRHASPRSVWFRSSARGAVALAAAVAAADLSGVQHGFWVVLGTLSVLRTNAAATGSTAWRALAGTVAGFAVGAALLLAIGTGQTALWVALPIAVLVAAYAPGTAPFAVGQAAFTVTVVVLFNLLVPAGWKVGLLRIEDVAIGCAVSLVVGVLVWPRGAGAVVGDDLADAFRDGAAYLTQAVDWSLGLRPHAPDTAVATITAGIRLDDALRLYLAEQGTKRVAKDELWSLVMATVRLRLTATSIADLRSHALRDGTPPPGPAGQDLVTLQRLTAELANFYERIAAEVGPPRRTEPPPVVAPSLDGLDGLDAQAGPDGQASPGREDSRDAQNARAGNGAGRAQPAPAHYPRALWIREFLHHLGEHAEAITTPAEHLARQRRVPWWR